MTPEKSVHTPQPHAATTLKNPATPGQSHRDNSLFKHLWEMEDHENYKHDNETVNQMSQMSPPYINIGDITQASVPAY